ncbi:MAG: prolyl-tRNA synthetase associated domain-containing protein [Pseudomonadota bacterium]
MPPATPDQLFAFLDQIGVAHHTVHHRPVFTVEDGADLKAQMPGGHSKNLFLKDKKGAPFLLCALAESRIDLNAVSKLIGAARFSFGSAELLLDRLGVTPGSVTIYALINDPEQRVTLLLDQALLEHDPINFHPLSNDATMAVSPEGLLRFLGALGRTPVRLAFAPDGTPSRVD